MGTSKQFPLRLPLKLRDDLHAAAQFEKRPMNQLIVDAIVAYLNREVAEIEEAIEHPSMDPILLRMFSDDSKYDIREWTADEGGRGETTIPVGTRIKTSTLRMIEAVLAHPACPLVTRSDFLRDAIYLGLYVAAKARLGDEEIAAFARAERRLRRTIGAQERFNSIQNLLHEMQTTLDNCEGGSEVPSFIYRQVGGMLEENVTRELTFQALVVAQQAWALMPDDEVKWALAAKYADMTAKVVTGE